MGIDPISAGLDLANTVAGLIGRFIPDPAQQAQAQLEVMKTIKDWDSQQNDINKQYAQMNSFYMAGARPAFLWVGVFYFLYSYIIIPITMYAAYATGHPIPKPPDLDNHIYELVTLLLGVSGMRTYEKMSGGKG